MYTNDNELRKLAGQPLVESTQVTESSDTIKAFDKAMARVQELLRKNEPIDSLKMRTALAAMNKRKADHIKTSTMKEDTVTEMPDMEKADHKEKFMKSMKKVQEMMDKDDMDMKEMKIAMENMDKCKDEFCDKEMK